MTKRFIPFLIAVAASLSLTAKDIHVSPSGSDASPYDTIGSATPSLQTAVAFAEEGDCILVHPGEYNLGKTGLDIAKGITIEGVGTRESIIVYGGIRSDSKHLIHCGATGLTIRGITIAGALSGQLTDCYGGITVDANGATIDNCIVRGFKTKNLSVHGAGINISKGLISNCIISNNFVTSSGGGGSSGGGIYASGSGVLIDRCQIVDNHSSSGSGAGGGGAYLQSGATIRNSLFLRNRSGNVGGGLYLRAAKAYNCTLINNKITFNPTGSSPAIYTTGTCVVENCITWNNIKHDIVSDPVDPGFVDGPNGNYHLTPASPFIDVVSTMDLTEQSDLEGNARVKGDGVDCGCYELDQLTPSVGIYYDCNSYVGPTNFTFKAKAFPIDATISDLYWTLDGTEPSAENNAFSGNNVVRELSPGIYSVRCKGTLNGSPFDITRENWITVKGLEIYVRETNPNAREPHDTLDTATTDLLKAVSMASSNSVIYVDEGTYTLPRHISMDNAITLISLKGPEKTLIYCTVSTTHRVSMIEMTHKMACLSGFTIDGINPESQTRPQRYGGISIRKSGAIVTNCIIRNHITENNSKNGSGISMTDGLLIDSVISNNITKSSASSELNGAVHISGGACAER